MTWLTPISDVFKDRAIPLHNVLGLVLFFSVLAIPLLALCMIGMGFLAHDLTFPRPGPLHLAPWHTAPAHSLICQLILLTSFQVALGWMVFLISPLLMAYGYKKKFNEINEKMDSYRLTRLAIKKENAGSGLRTVICLLIVLFTSPFMLIENPDTLAGVVLIVLSFILYLIIGVCVFVFGASLIKKVKSKVVPVSVDDAFQQLPSHEKSNAIAMAQASGIDTNGDDFKKAATKDFNDRQEKVSQAADQIDKETPPAQSQSKPIPRL